MLTVPRVPYLLDRIYGGRVRDVKQVHARYKKSFWVLCSKAALRCDRYDKAVDIRQAEARMEIGFTKTFFIQHGHLD